MKKTLLSTVLLVGGLIFIASHGVNAGSSTDLAQAKPYVEFTDELVEEEIIVPTVEVVNTVNEIEEVPIQEINPCPYGHENCDGNHVECGKGHVDCTVNHSLCTQNHENCDGIHQGQHRRGQGNAQGNHRGLNQGNGCHNIQE